MLGSCCQLTCSGMAGGRQEGTAQVTPTTSTQQPGPAKTVVPTPKGASLTLASTQDFLALHTLCSPCHCRWPCSIRGMTFKLWLCHPLARGSSFTSLGLIFPSVKMGTDNANRVALSGGCNVLDTVTAHSRSQCRVAMAATVGLAWTISIGLSLSPRLQSLPMGICVWAVSLPTNLQASLSHSAPQQTPNEIQDPHSGSQSWPRMNG